MDGSAFQSNARSPGPLLVAEADESDASLVSSGPAWVITNLEAGITPTTTPTSKALVETLLKFADAVPCPGEQRLSCCEHFLRPVPWFDRTLKGTSRPSVEPMAAALLYSYERDLFGRRSPALPAAHNLAMPRPPCCLPLQGLSFADLSVRDDRNARSPGAAFNAAA